jgi:hypothetical protein
MFLHLASFGLGLPHVSHGIAYCYHRCWLGRKEKAADNTDADGLLSNPSVSVSSVARGIKVFYPCPYLRLVTTVALSAQAHAPASEVSAEPALDAPVAAAAEREPVLLLLPELAAPAEERLLDEAAAVGAAPRHALLAVAAGQSAQHALPAALAHARSAADHVPAFAAAVQCVVLLRVFQRAAACAPQAAVSERVPATSAERLGLAVRLSP